MKNLLNEACEKLKVQLQNWYDTRKSQRKDVNGIAVEVYKFKQENPQYESVFDEIHYEVNIKPNSYIGPCLNGCCPPLARMIATGITVEPLKQPFNNDRMKFLSTYKSVVETDKELIKEKLEKRSFYPELQLQSEEHKTNETKKEKLTLKACADLELHIQKWFETKRKSGAGFQSTELGMVKKEFMDAHPEYVSCEMDIDFDYIEKSRTYKGCGCCGDPPKIIVSGVYAKPMKWEEICYLATFGL